jgi:hypothetical protein
MDAPLAELGVPIAAQQIHSAMRHKTMTRYLGFMGAVCGITGRQ